MAATTVTLNDLEGHSYRFRAFLSAIRRTFVQHFTRFQLAVRSRGSSALAELLVPILLFVLVAVNFEYWYRHAIYSNG